MSLAQNPMTGEMRQSMANFVTTVFRGRNVIRAKVFMPKNVNSPAQQKQRACFKVVLDTYESFGGITDIGFPGRPRILSPLNAFMLANLPHAVNTSGAVPVIDYTKLVVSEGSLPEVIVPSAVCSATGITVSYKTNIRNPKVKATDEIVAFALLKTGELIIERQVRNAEALSTILLAYPNIEATNVECCFVFAISEDGSKATKNGTLVVVS